MKGCKTCELLARRDRGEAPLWDSILRTQSWDVVHSYNSALPGWLVVVARRHIEAVDELTDEEASELGMLVRRVSLALRQVTGCIKTYVIQFAEHPDHRHVHFHIVPRMEDQPEDRRSVRIFEYLGRPPEEWVSEARMNEIAAKVRRALGSEETGAGAPVAAAPDADQGCRKVETTKDTKETKDRLTRG